MLVTAPLAVYLGLQPSARRDLAYAGACVLVTVALSWGPADEFEQLERAWVVLLTGAIASMVLVNGGRSWIRTSLGALGLAGGAAAVLMVVTHLTWGKVAGVVEQHFFPPARAVVDLIAPVGSPSREPINASVLAVVRALSSLLPGVVLLQSLAAQALAWALYRRIARTPRGEPLGALALFRFNDHLIWGVALSLVAVLLPRLAWARALGGNLLLFFGGLYLVRGVAVLAAVASAVGFTGLVASLAVLAGTVLLWWILAPALLVLGLTDTLVDWRLRLARAAGKP